MEEQDNENLLIRKAQTDDEKEIYDIELRTIREKCSDVYTKEQIDVWIDLIQNKNKIGWILPAIENPLYEFYVAEKESKIVGFGLIFMNNEFLREINIPFIALLQELYTHPDYLRQGIATKLLAKLESIAKKEGCNLILATAFLNSASFFKKEGYKIKEKYQEFIYKNGAIERFSIEKSLSL